MRICDRCGAKNALEVVTQVGSWKDSSDFCGECHRFWQTEALGRAMYIFRHDQSSQVFNTEIQRLSAMGIALGKSGDGSKKGV